jgi:hypothetical protein
LRGVVRISTESWIAAAAFLCFVIIALLDYQQQSRTTQRFDTFSSYDYQPGGYHAWYDLLQREGFRVQRFQRRPAYLNDAVDTLIIANNAYDAMLRSKNGQSLGFFAPADFVALQRWVKNGGHLVWLSDTAAAVGLPDLLSRQIHQGESAQGDLHFPPLAQSGLKKDEAIAVAASSLTAGVHSVSGLGTYRIPFAGSTTVVPLVADDTGATAVWYRLGKGAIIVVSDESLFQNSRLAKADNARLAYNFAVSDVPRGTVAFEEWSHGYQAGDTWWTILPKPLQWAILIFGGAVLLAIIGSVIRFGPAVRLPVDNERTSEEYVRSMAGLMKRAHAARKAVRDLAQLAHHEVAQALGLPDSVPAATLAQRLRGSERGERIADDLLTLDRIAGYEHPSPAELVRAACTCFTLRKEYESHGEWRRSYSRSDQRRSA